MGRRRQLGWRRKFLRWRRRERELVTMKIHELLANIRKEEILAAIAQVEGETSAEVRVHLEPTIRKYELRWFAERTFERLGITKTALRNGVLLFLAAEEQNFIILGDKGIHERVGDEYWESIVARAGDEFRRGAFTEGIVSAIREVGAKLKEHFPRSADDVNELPDDLSVGDSD
jgi:uncharacterized membrane protein